MLKNDIEKTLQAHCPEPPEDFAEMIDDKVFHLMAERQGQKAVRKKKRLRLVPVTAAALVVVMCAGILAANGHFGLINRPDEILPGEGRYTAQPIETVLAQGTVPEETDKTEVSKAAEDLESEYSILKTRNELLEIKDKLVPLNLSCEDQGIRMEVEAAVAEGREAWILYSLENMRDDLDQYHESIQFPSVRWYNSRPYQKCEQRKVNVEGNKTTYLMNMEYAEPILPENGMLPVTLDNIRFIEYKDVDLTEIISEYADVSEGITPPEPVVENNYLPEWKHGKRIILDNSHPLDISLWEGVVLTGTGWINGELHIQLHYPDHTDHFLRAELRQYDTDSPYNGTDGYPYILDHYEQMWDGDGDGVVDGIEFTLDPEDDMEQRKIILHLEKTAKVVEGNWTVEFPLNDIRKEGDRFEQNGLMFRLEKDNTVTLISDPSYQQKKEIVIPEITMDYVRKIGEGAFENCVNLQSAKITKYVTEIEDHAFKGCVNLTSVDLWRRRIPAGQDLYRDCTGVVSIGKSAFEGCTGLVSIDLPDQVTTIGGSAFRGCVSLVSVSIPDGAKFEGGYAFADCTSLVSVTLPGRMENLEDYMFSGCESLEMVFIREETRTIGRGAFRNCRKLNLVEIPYSVYYISDYAFEGCVNLEKIEIPENVSYIGENAFAGCGKLVCSVYEGSYAQQYCEENGIPYEIRQDK